MASEEDNRVNDENDEHRSITGRHLRTRFGRRIKKSKTVKRIARGVVKPVADWVLDEDNTSLEKPRSAEKDEVSVRETPIEKDGVNESFSNTQGDDPD